MKKNLMHLTLLSLLTLFLAVTVQAQPRGENSLLWKVYHPDIPEPSYLFGTMHAIPADDFTMPEILEELIHNVEQLYLEINMDDIDPMEVMQMMMLPDGEGLQDVMEEDAYNSLREKLEAHDIEEEMLEMFMKMKPIASYGLVFNSIFDEIVVMENELLQLANEAGVEIRGLETIEFQFDLFDNIPVEDQVDMFFGQDLEEEFHTVTQLYLRQDLDRLYRYTIRSRWGDVGNEFLYERNHHWVEVLEDVMGESPVLIAVGAAHLPGEKGLINLLRASGFDLEPVSFEF